MHRDHPTPQHLSTSLRAADWEVLVSEHWHPYAPSPETLARVDPDAAHPLRSDVRRDGRTL